MVVKVHLECNNLIEIAITFMHDKTLLTTNLNTENRMKLIGYAWRIALFSSDTWTLRKLKRKYMESLERSLKRMEKIK